MFFGGISCVGNFRVFTLEILISLSYGGVGTAFDFVEFLGEFVV